MKTDTTDTSNNVLKNNGAQKEIEGSKTDENPDGIHVVGDIVDVRFFLVRRLFLILLSYS